MEIIKDHLLTTIGPDTITPDDVRGLSLSETSQRFGTLGLYVKLDDSLEQTGLAEVPRVMDALHLGLTLHANDRRTNGHYNDHLLRVTLRMLDTYGIRDPDLIAACPVHDSLEDHPRDLVKTLSGRDIEDRAEARQVGRELIEQFVSLKTADLVQAVTNPDIAEGEDRIAVYLEHTKAVVMGSPEARLLKLTDFTDNAVGNHYTLGNKRIRLDQKYVGAFRLHSQGLMMPDSLIVSPLREQVQKQLALAHMRALARLAMAA